MKFIAAFFAIAALAIAPAAAIAQIGAGHGWASRRRSRTGSSRS